MIIHSVVEGIFSRTQGRYQKAAWRHAIAELPQVRQWFRMRTVQPKEQETPSMSVLE